MNLGKQTGRMVELEPMPAVPAAVEEVHQVPPHYLAQVRLYEDVAEGARMEQEVLTR